MTAQKYEGISMGLFCIVFFRYLGYIFPKFFKALDVIMRMLVILSLFPMSFLFFF
jgi:hypothetical protein